MAAIWAGLLAVAAGACHKMPLVAPSGTAITLIAGTNVLPVNGSTDITAILIEGGGSFGNTGANIEPGTGSPVHNGTLVTFTTSLGRIEPSEARTTNGRATVKLFADGRSGLATIAAISGAALQTLEINIGAAAAIRIIVTADPSSLPATGGTAAISARVEDEQGNGLGGVPVSFTTNAGTLTATTALTNDNGIATVGLASTAAARVTANAGGVSGSVDVAIKARTDLSITPPASAAVSTPVSFTVAVGGTAAVTDARVDWGDGTTTSLDTLTGSRTVVHLFSRSGALRVTLSGTDADGTRVSVSTDVVVSALSLSVTFTPNPPVFSNSVLFTATITPAGASIERYEWDFDGDVKVSSGPQMSYVFQTKGTKNIVVRAIPTRGSAVTTQLQIQVN